MNVAALTQTQRHRGTEAQRHTRAHARTRTHAHAHTRTHTHTDIRTCTNTNTDTDRATKRHRDSDAQRHQDIDTQARIQCVPSIGILCDLDVAFILRVCFGFVRERRMTRTARVMRTSLCVLRSGRVQSQCMDSPVKEYTTRRDFNVSQIICAYLRVRLVLF